MFTGIVQGKAKVLDIVRNPGLTQLRIQFPQNTLNQITQGASIAINGTCLTVTQFQCDEACFDVMQETLRLTNLAQLSIGAEVNFERAARIGDEIGGHLMSGHIHGQAQIKDIERAPHNCTLWLTTPEALQKYILPKGFVGLNGCSLTIGTIKQGSFSIHLIPETLSVTTFGTAKTGDYINLEIDHQTQTIVDTVERIQQWQVSQSN